ncbi:MAG: hypothetical protein ACOYYS_10215 [Chloroflexota bacterium]
MSINPARKIEIKPVEDSFTTCNCCRHTERVSAIVFELRIKHSNFTQCITLCERHMDELSQAVLAMQAVAK